MDWIPIGESIPVLTANQERIRDMLRENKSIWYICHTMRMRREHVEEEIYDIRRKESIMGNPTTSGKLSPQQKAAIYQAYKNGAATQQELAKQYGVCNQAISYTIKRMREAEESMAAAVDLPAAAQVPAPAPEPERKAAVVNEDFENAIEKMIEDAKAEKKFANAEEKSKIAEVSEPVQDPEPELEDCENGIPNTPLDPITKEPEPLPPVVLRAVNGHLSFIQERIEALEYRISEIEDEIKEYQKDADKLQEWKEQQRWR